MEQRYFYDWETFGDTEEANVKIKAHMSWTNNKPMQIFKGKIPT